MIEGKICFLNYCASILGIGKEGVRRAFIIIMSIVVGATICRIIYLVFNKNSKNSEKQKSEPEKMSDNALALGIAPFPGHSPSLTDTIV